MIYALRVPHVRMVLPPLKHIRGLPDRDFLTIGIRKNYIVRLRVEACAVDDRAGRDDADDIALDKALGERRVLGLLADGDLVALGDQARDVGVARMIGNAAHRRLILRRLAAVAGRQRQIELARGELSILVEHLVEVAQAEKEDRILILFLDLQILLHHRRDLGHDSSSLSFSLKSKIYTVKSEPAGISPRRSPIYKTL